MSSFDKYLAPITVPTGGWDFVWAEGGSHTATVSAGDYDTVLHLASELEDRIQAIDASSFVSVSSTGTVTIWINGMTSVTWGSTNDDLEAALGFAGDETVSAGIVTSTNQHNDGWYPGVLSYGSNHGAGRAIDEGWVPMDVAGKQYAGSGEGRYLGPDRYPYERRVRYSMIKRAERNARKTGPLAFLDRWRTAKLYWYPDRDNGTEGSHGTQGEPGADSYHTDADCDYYLVRVHSAEVKQSSKHPDGFDVSLVLRCEPT